MVSSISGIGSAASLMMPQYQPIRNITEVSGFEEMVSSIKDRVQLQGEDEVNAVTPQTASAPADAPSKNGGTKGAEEGKNDPADLNKDGTVTAEEAIKYMQMQMVENMSDDMMEMADDNSQKFQQKIGNDTSDFQMKQASNAYKSVASSIGKIADTMLGIALSA